MLWIFCAIITSNKIFDFFYLNLNSHKSSKSLELKQIMLIFSHNFFHDKAKIMPYAFNIYKQNNAYEIFY